MEDKKEVQQGTEKKAKGLTTRQRRLKDWLDNNFQSGKFFSIEEVVKGVVDKDGIPYYTLNKNPHKHDKCLSLSRDVRAINFNITDRYIPIVKDTKGGIKLAENEQEIKTFVGRLQKQVENQCKYFNTIIYKSKLDGTVPLFTFAGRVLGEDEIKPVDAYKRETHE